MRGKVGLGVFTGAAIISFLVPFFLGPIGVGGLSDKATPLTTPRVEGVQGNADWWRSHVKVTLTAEDDTALAKIHYRVGSQAEQVVQTPSMKLYSTSFNVNTDGTQSLQYWAEDRAGHREEPKTMILKIDTAAPVVSFDLKDEYTQLENVRISFSVRDEQSARVSFTAKLDDETDVSNGETVLADDLAHGVHKVRVTASDEAGNTADATDAFRVKKLRELITEYGDNGEIDNGGIINSLYVKADHALDKIDQGQTKVGLNKLNALENHLEAQMGKHIDTDAANALLALTTDLMNALTQDA